MMKNLILIAVSLLFAFISAQAQTDEQTIINLSKKKFGWMTQMKLDSLESILDERLLFVHSNGWTETKEEFIKDIKSGKLRYVSIDVAEASARIYTNTAIVTGKGKFKVLLDGSELIINLFYTEVYISKNGMWLLASRHSNRLP
jgi:hypothetical protein